MTATFFLFTVEIWPSTRLKSNFVKESAAQRTGIGFGWHSRASWHCCLEKLLHNNNEQLTIGSRLACVRRVIDARGGC